MYVRRTRPLAGELISAVPDSYIAALMLKALGRKVRPASASATSGHGPVRGARESRAEIAQSHDSTFAARHAVIALVRGHEQCILLEGHGVVKGVEKVV